MKKIFLSTVLFSTILPARAIPEPENIHPMKTLTAQSFHKEMRKLVKEHGAQNIMIVSDLDGTLNNRSTPSPNYFSNARGHMPEILKHYEKKGVSFVISSAWNNMEDIIERLELIGLKENVQASYGSIERLSNTPLPLIEEVSNAQAEALEGRLSLTSSMALSEDDMIQSYIKEKAQNTLESLQNQRFDVVRSGRVVSVKKLPSRDPYFRAKHHALDFISAEHAERGCRPVVVFLEDSMDAIQKFYNEMPQANWYHYAQHVYAFHFNPIHGDDSPDDIVKKFQSVPRNSGCPILSNSLRYSSE